MLVEVEKSHFKIIHCDLWAKYHTPSSCSARYFLTIVDDFFRAMSVYLLFYKTEVMRCFVLFSRIKHQYDSKVKIVRRDISTEFKGM